MIRTSLNLKLTDEQFSLIRSVFSDINQKFTIYESAQRPRVNLNNKEFAEDALQLLYSHPALFPTLSCATSYQNDLILLERLKELAALSRVITEKLEDTVTLAGSEVYITALTVYKLLGMATEDDPQNKGTIELYRQLKAKLAVPSIVGTEQYQP